MNTGKTKRKTDTSTKTKHGADRTLTPSPAKNMAVIRRPTPGQTIVEIVTPSESTATAKPKKPTYEAQMRALSPAVRLRRKLANTAKRLSKISGEVRSWANAPPELRDASSTTMTMLSAMLAGAVALPDDFKPERVRKALAGQLAVGTLAALRPKVSVKYDGILDPEERQSLEIVSVALGFVSVRTIRGACLVLPRAHVATSTIEGQTSGDRAPFAEPVSPAS